MFEYGGRYAIGAYKSSFGRRFLTDSEKNFIQKS